MSWNDLPNEIILNICDRLDIQTLIKISQTNSLNNQICNVIIKERKEEYLKEKDIKIQIDKLFNYLKIADHFDYPQITLNKIIDDKANTIKIQKFDPMFLIESISRVPFDFSQELEQEYRMLFPWILLEPLSESGEIISPRMKERTWRRSVRTGDLDLVRKAIENSLRFGYIIHEQLIFFL